MDTQEKIRRICDMLQTLGEPGSAKQLAGILSMCPETIVRYLNGRVTTPKDATRESIDVFYRILVSSINGNQDARRVLDAALGQHGLLRMGLGGVLITLGMTWLVRDQNVDAKLNESQSFSNPCASSADRPTTRKSTTPSSASRNRQSARRPSKNG